PDLPFVVEVDASSSDLGAILSQHHGEPGKLHPCAFYSRKLTAAEANYDVGNRELLAIKAALEEWRHWLEGARHPFQVLTGHCNLEYLRGAKRLNPWQARWALFFTRFQFMVTYRLGSKNGKANALSRRFETASNPVLVEPILPATAILAPVRWNLVEEIQRSHADDPPPAGCPPTKICASPVCLQVMQWIHEAPAPVIRDSANYTARPPSLLVALPGLRCGGVHSVMPHLRSGTDQSPTPGGVAEAPSNSSTPLVSPIGGFLNGLARLRRLYNSSGGSGPLL
ncbi:hypothetical protein QTP70_008630, partial [Hemibagrus guttatus]